jgi:hypothetical protein
VGRASRRIGPKVVPARAWAAGLVISLLVACTADAPTFEPESSPEPSAPVIPLVVGLKKSEARAAIREAGFRPASLSEVSRERPGSVIAQFPSEGQEIPPGSTVHFIVSKGWPMVPYFSPGWRVGTTGETPAEESRVSFRGTPLSVRRQRVDVFPGDRHRLHPGSQQAARSGNRRHARGGQGVHLQPRILAVPVPAPGL